MARFESSMHGKSTEKRQPRSSTASRTDWEHLDSLRNEEIDKSDIPEPTPEQFARAVLRKGLKPAPRKKRLTLRLDEEVLAWFKRQGSGYQTRINTLLRAYMEAHEEKM